MRASVGLIALWCVGLPALAEPPAGPVPEAAPPAVARTEAVVPVELPARSTEQQGDNSLSLDELDDLRGGETIVIQHTSQILTATNTGNSVNGDTIGSGAVNLSSNAFNGYDGIGNFVINTGHNNNLQGSISVSIAMTPQ